MGTIESTPERTPGAEAAVSKRYDCKADGLTITGALKGSALEVSLVGRLDTLSAPDLLELWQDAEARGAATVTCEMSELDYLSSAGLRVLVLIYRTVGEGALTLTGLNAKVRESLYVTGFADMLGV